jgi:hypothetical protein
VFSGIPLVERVRERTCGVWVVNIETGQTLGFLRFETGVQEIFAVQVLRGMRFPELLEWNDERLATSYVLPDEALADVVLRSESEVPSAGKHETQNPKFETNRGRTNSSKFQAIGCRLVNLIFSLFRRLDSDVGVCPKSGRIDDELPRFVFLISRQDHYLGLGRSAQVRKQNSLAQ